LDALVVAAHALILAAALAARLRAHGDALQAAHVLRAVVLAGVHGAMDALVMLFVLHDVSLLLVAPLACPRAGRAMREKNLLLDAPSRIIGRKNCIGLFETIQSLNKTRDVRARLL